MTRFKSIFGTALLCAIAVVIGVIVAVVLGPWGLLGYMGILFYLDFQKAFPPAFHNCLWSAFTALVLIITIYAATAIHEGSEMMRDRQADIAQEQAECEAMGEYWIGESCE